METLGIRKRNMTNIKGFFGENRWLSNFYPCKIKIGGEEFSSVEQYYMYRKSPDKDYRAKILKEHNPKKLKRLGYQCVLRPDWEEFKRAVMNKAVFLKFSQNEDLKEKLLATGEAYLEETNKWNDTYWGVCNGKGENYLGKILMDIRKTIRVLDND